MTIAEQVDAIMMDSLFRVDELHAAVEQDEHGVPKGTVIVEGIMRTFSFQPERLAKHRQEVKGILLQMAKPFHKATGAGWSFLNLCVTEDGEQWGEHANVEALVCLAIGLKMGSYCMPRDMWNMLPGGMPYVVFDTEAIEVKP